VRVFYEVYGDGEPSVLFLPTWTIVHSRVWKLQIPYLSRHCRVIVFDPRGNGKSDRPTDPDAYAERQFADDALAVLDQTGTKRAYVVGYSMGAQRALLLAAEHPERVEGLVLIGPAVPLASESMHAEARPQFDRRLEDYHGWQKYNRNYWLENYAEFAQFFFSQLFCEPHSTKQIEDCVGWALETTPEVLVATQDAPALVGSDIVELASRVRCPSVVIHGTEDRIRPLDSGAALANLLGSTFVPLQGSGHAPHGRDPVKVNLILRDFACPLTPRTWIRGRSRRKRALFVSSPIGLGHAQRDVAIATQLRTLHPEIEIDWLAQHPVTAVLEANGERIHPLSAELANESRHIESESAEHDLHCFHAWRRMDEILLANFMVFHDLVRDHQYDLWIADEGWDIDYYLHENPEEKSAAYVWLTDFVGWLPMPDGGEQEALLTADYNSDMIEQIARFPRVRDRSIFIGETDDVIDGHFGPDLPLIREWTKENFAFPGYVTGFDPAEFADRDRLRAELGYRPEEAVCIVTVGGSGVGADLLRRVVDAFPEAKQLVPRLRMIVVAGPRINPQSLPLRDGLEVRPYVHNLYRHLAACDLAVVQGGLTTAMELTANRRPFLSFPLRHHFEQNFHVRHRLERYRAGRVMDFALDGPHEIAEAIAAEIGRDVDYAPVQHDGAERAAALIAELL
jgi:pimeloyl-ACP methyl ester carboxylesterase